MKTEPIHIVQWHGVPPKGWKIKRGGIAESFSSGTDGAAHGTMHITPKMWLRIVTAWSVLRGGMSCTENVANEAQVVRDNRAHVDTNQELQRQIRHLTGIIDSERQARAVDSALHKLDKQAYDDTGLQRPADSNDTSGT